eukprot:GHVR01134299.1.p1 GENE.GHVR01134299.1~~GHVR01134299.1.p1  ORF type:complete len:462 (-),score=123.98 GHVR01134299.1:100-1485(-)
MGACHSGQEFQVQLEAADELVLRGDTARLNKKFNEAETYYHQGIETLECVSNSKKVSSVIQLKTQQRIQQVKAILADTHKEKNDTNTHTLVSPPSTHTHTAAPKRKPQWNSAASPKKKPPWNSGTVSGIPSKGSRGGGPSTSGALKGGGPPVKGSLPSTSNAASPQFDEFEEKLVKEILDTAPAVSWNQIAGLSLVKETLMEIVITPNLNPSLFTGLRAPPKGVLLFGPPGNGKTMIAKAVAKECGATFFNISASSITSKWLGESEKQMRALFSVAGKMQPCVIFIDEIDSLLSSRSSGEHEASRRVKTEFLVQLDGVSTTGTERILVLGATNRPQELDDAALRRMVKRIYIPLPDTETRKVLIENLLSEQTHHLEKKMDTLLKLTEGYSGSDLSALCREAAMASVRGISQTELKTTKAEDLRPIELTDFKEALKVIRASVGPETLKAYDTWNSKFGTKSS